MFNCFTQKLCTYSFDILIGAGKVPWFFRVLCLFWFFYWLTAQYYTNGYSWTLHSIYHFAPWRILKGYHAQWICWLEFALLKNQDVGKKCGFWSFPAPTLWYFFLLTSWIIFNNNITLLSHITFMGNLPWNGLHMLKTSAGIVHLIGGFCVFSMAKDPF